MTTEIRIYVEGEGDQKDTRARLRTAFGVFLKELRDRAREKRVRWTIIVCGSRSSTFEFYKTALKRRAEAFNVLLVDSEGPMLSERPWQHLKSRRGDNWDNPGMPDTCCHLMVQIMESWLIADREKLREYYGKDFRESALPRNTSVEDIDKGSLVIALKRATERTKKRTYDKTRHAPQILEAVRPSEVRSKAPHCKRLFDTLFAEIDGA